MLTHMLLMANFAYTKLCTKKLKITDIVTDGYSSEGTQRDLPDEYQYVSV